MSEDALNIAGILNRDAIAALVSGCDGVPLVSEYRDLTSQLQPNGFDLTVAGVAAWAVAGGAGSVGVSDDHRRVPEPLAVDTERDGWWRLPPGSYLVTFNEVVNLPRWLMALGRPRSSLLRMGVALHTAVWDAGYAGRSQALLVVHHSGGFRLQRNARIAQLVFLPLNRPDATGYAGIYQRENL